MSLVKAILIAIFLWSVAALIAAPFLGMWLKDKAYKARPFIKGGEWRPR